MRLVHTNYSDSVIEVRLAGIDPRVMEDACEKSKHIQGRAGVAELEVLVRTFTPEDGHGRP